MVTGNAHLDEMVEFRQIYLEQRRQLISKALAVRHTTGGGGLYGEELKALQDCIEAIDRAIMDERSLLGLGPPTFGV
jgi:hypothetical protein